MKTKIFLASETIRGSSRVDWLDWSERSSVAVVWSSSTLCWARCAAHKHKLNSHHLACTHSFLFFSSPKNIPSSLPYREHERIIATHSFFSSASVSFSNPSISKVRKAWGSTAAQRWAKPTSLKTSEIEPNVTPRQANLSQVLCEWRELDWDVEAYCRGILGGV